MLWQFSWLQSVSIYFLFAHFRMETLRKINFVVVWPYGHTFTDSLKSFEDMIHYRSFEHNLSSCDTKACRKRMRDSNSWPLWYRAVLYQLSCLSPKKKFSAKQSNFSLVTRKFVNFLFPPFPCNSSYSYNIPKVVSSWLSVSLLSFGFNFTIKLIQSVSKSVVKLKCELENYINHLA